MKTFEEFMKVREEAAQAYVRGDAEPLSHVAALVSKATFFGPQGGYVEGAEAVLGRYKRDAAHIADGETYFEVLQMGSSEDVAYWTGIQHATARMGDSKEVSPVDLRVTEVFRREGSVWKMVHRHADPHVTEAKKK